MFNFIWKQFSLFSRKHDSGKGGVEYPIGITRFLSVFIDLISFMVLLLCMNFVFQHLFQTDEVFKVMSKFSMRVTLNPEEELLKSRYIFWEIVNQCLQVFLIFILTVWMWVRFAATPGKLILGLRIVDATTYHNLGFGQATKRFFATILSVLPLFMGIIWSNFDSKGQCWHDKIADTVVVTKKSLKNC